MIGAIAVCLYLLFAVWAYRTITRRADDDEEPPELPKLKRWKPVRVLGCSPNTTTPRQRIHRIQRRG